MRTVHEGHTFVHYNQLEAMPLALGDLHDVRVEAIAVNQILIQDLALVQLNLFNSALLEMYLSNRGKASFRGFVHLLYQSKPSKPLSKPLPSKPLSKPLPSSSEEVEKLRKDLRKKLKT